MDKEAKGATNFITVLSDVCAYEINRIFLENFVTTCHPPKSQR